MGRGQPTASSCCPSFAAKQAHCRTRSLAGGSYFVTKGDSMSAKLRLPVDAILYLSSILYRNCYPVSSRFARLWNMADRMIALGVTGKPSYSRYKLRIIIIAQCELHFACPFRCRRGALHNLDIRSTMTNLSFLSLPSTPGINNQKSCNSSPSTDHETLLVLLMQPISPTTPSQLLIPRPSRSCPSKPQLLKLPDPTYPQPPPRLNLRQPA